MTAMRIRVLIGAALVMLLLFTSTAAFAAPPVVTIWEGTGSITFSCGSFDVLEDYSYYIRTTHFYNNQGSLNHVVSHLSWDGSLTNTTTGQTLRDPGQQITHYKPSQGTFAYTGLTYRIIVPGRGIVVNDIGRLVIDENGNIIFQAGTFQVINGGNDVLCAAFD